MQVYDEMRQQQQQQLAMTSDSSVSHTRSVAVVSVAVSSISQSVSVSGQRGAILNCCTTLISDASCCIERTRPRPVTHLAATLQQR